LIKENYITSGTHEYIEKEEVQLGGTVNTIITFISAVDYPYPNCLCLVKLLTSKRVTT